MTSNRAAVKETSSRLVNQDGHDHDNGKGMYVTVKHFGTLSVA